MKKFFICFLIFGLFKSSFAETCPRIENANPNHPPHGWSLLLPPAMEDQQYAFSAAIHSLNGAYYEGHVICKYATCPNHFCPAYALISDNTYSLPNQKLPPWDAKSVLNYTFTCIPPDHNPNVCIFE